MIQLSAKMPQHNHVSHDPLKPTAKCGGPALCDLCFGEVMKLSAGAELDDWVYRLVYQETPPAGGPYSHSVFSAAYPIERCLERFGAFSLRKDGADWFAIVGQGDPSWQARGETPALATCRAAVFAFRRAYRSTRKG